MRSLYLRGVGESLVSRDHEECMWVDQVRTQEYRLLGTAHCFRRWQLRTSFQAALDRLKRYVLLYVNHCCSLDFLPHLLVYTFSIFGFIHFHREKGLHSSRLCSLQLYGDTDRPGCQFTVRLVYLCNGPTEAVKTYTAAAAADVPVILRRSSLDHHQLQELLHSCCGRHATRHKLRHCASAVRRSGVRA